MRLSEGLHGLLDRQQNFFAEALGIIQVFDLTEKALIFSAQKRHLCGFIPGPPRLGMRVTLPRILRIAF